MAADSEVSKLLANPTGPDGILDRCSVIACFGIVWLVAAYSVAIDRTICPSNGELI